MNRLHRNALLPLLLALLAAGQAHAQDGDEQSSYSLTGNLALTSNYISRGFTQTWGQPALQGGIDYAHPSGFYAGTWASSISGTEFRGGNIEWDFYAGYGGSLGPLGYVLALSQYTYPGTSSPLIGNRKYNYTEVRVGVSHGIVSLDAYITVSDDYFGTFDDASGDAIYYDFNVKPDLGHGYSLLLHAGAGRFGNHPEANWVDYKLGLTKALPKEWSIGAAVTHAKDKHDYWTGSNFSIDASGNTYTRDLAKTAFVVTLGKTF